MGAAESKAKPDADDDVTVDPVCAAAAELAKQMVKGPVKVIPRTTEEHEIDADVAKVKEATDTLHIKEDVHTIVITGASQIASKYGGGLVGVIGRIMADELWSAVFPHLTDLANGGISHLMEQQLEQGDLDRINGVLHDFEQALRINYADDKRNSNLADPADRQRLHRYLLTLDEHLLGVIGAMMQDRIARTGLPCFLLLAGLRLALYQEMAVVDPENKSPDLNPALSPRYATPHTGVVAMYAREYAQHARKVWAEVVEDRKKKIVLHTSHFWGIPFLGQQHWFDDAATGEAGVKCTLDTFKEYEDAEVEKLGKRFCFPDDIAANWEKLVDMPINTNIEDGSEVDHQE
ncbi:Hypp9122 [Branchiostoma lanceolatum]|uniref:Hypp9122 protein n=1 Tax=Branchiostoma lanceolatum TaxID=7740 RepID=A0A8J9ZDI7_BRALA|nr:Hypp9122 [Branchiostoma lanceolatum]